jgi:hypothetical protein
VKKVPNKMVIVLWALWVTARLSWAVDIVHDPGLAVQAAENELVNFAKWSKTEVDAAQTELNTLRTYENTIVQLARLGDPSRLRNLPVIRDVARVASTGQQIVYDYQQWQAYTNPQNFQGEANSILSAYRQPSWSGVLTAGGVQIRPSQTAFQFDIARFNISAEAEQQLQALEKQRLTLIQSRDATLQQIQSATDGSTVQKLHAALDGINSALAEIGTRETAINNETTYKAQQVSAAQAVSNTAQAERLQGSQTTVADREFQILGQMQNLFTPQHFGGRP